MGDNIPTDEEWAASLWPVTKGVYTAEQLVDVAKVAHRCECSTFDGGQANRMIHAEKWSSVSDDHRHTHIMWLVRALDAVQSAGFNVRMKTGRTSR
ncbi:MAG: hypothetical protein P1T08_12880 [Acidimicrobiia bacterium]|nr:hypothetical protein [Acidimicrobiia bacterium]